MSQMLCMVTQRLLIGQGTPLQLLGLSGTIESKHYLNWILIYFDGEAEGKPGVLMELLKFSAEGFWLRQLSSVTQPLYHCSPIYTRGTQSQYFTVRFLVS